MIIDNKDLEYKAFLKELYVQQERTVYTSILILDKKENVIRDIRGEVTAGSISVDGNSSVRRSGSLTFVATAEENDLTNIENDLSMNKKIKVLIGLKNNINKNFSDIIWFNQGIFIISQPNISHNLTGVTISLSLKDKMCLLNGTFGGVFPAPVTFSEYTQYYTECEFEGTDPKKAIKNKEGDYTHPNDKTIYILYNNKDLYDEYQNTLNNIILNSELDEKEKLNKKNDLQKEYFGDSEKEEDKGKGLEIKYYTWSATTSYEEQTESSKNELLETGRDVPQTLYDIIQTMVCNYGGEELGKIFIEDVPKQIKQSLYVSDNKGLYCYRFDGHPTRFSTENPYFIFDDLGIIKWNLENSETFTATVDTATKSLIISDDDINYSVEDGVLKCEIDEYAPWFFFNLNEEVAYVWEDFVYPGELRANAGDNITTILDKIKNQLSNHEYFYDIDGNFIFREKRNYLNKNYDPGFILVDDKEYLSLINENNFQVDYSYNSSTLYDFEENNILISAYSNALSYENIKNDFRLWGEDNKFLFFHVAIKERPTDFPTRYVKRKLDVNGMPDEDGRIELAEAEEAGAFPYIADDWRAELYLRGLTKRKYGGRPDLYEQEMIDFLPRIYNLYERKYKEDYYTKFNNLDYWIDFIDPKGTELENISVDAIGSRGVTIKNEKMKKLYSTNGNIANVILFNKEISDETEKTRQRQMAEANGLEFVEVDGEIFKRLSIGEWGYSGQELVRDQIYQKTDFASAINITSLPIYDLEPNYRISVSDPASGISGDYIIKNFTIPLDFKGTMSISATKALKRI